MQETGPHSHSGGQTDFYEMEHTRLTNSYPSEEIERDADIGESTGTTSENDIGVTENEFRNLNNNGGEAEQVRIPAVLDPGIGQKYVRNMDTRELIHLITNGVRRILLHSTNEQFRRTNFTKLKVSNTEDASAVFRKKFLQLCGLEPDCDNSPQLAENPQDEIPVQRTTSSSNGPTLSNSQQSTKQVPNLHNISATHSSEPNPAVAVLSVDHSSIHSSETFHIPSNGRLSPSILEDEELLTESHNSLLTSVTEISITSGAEYLYGNQNSLPLSNSEVNHAPCNEFLPSDDETDDLSQSLLENIEPAIVDERDVFSQNGLVNNWLRNVEIQAPLYNSQNLHTLSYPFSQGSHVESLKRQLSPCSPGQPNKLTRTEMQQALMTKLKVLRTSNSQNEDSSSTSNTQSQNFFD